MNLVLKTCTIRPWQLGDREALVRHANDRAIWRNLRDHFPHPYTLEDAEWWINDCAGETTPVKRCAICIDGEAAGGIGVGPGQDVAAGSWEIGYWIGQAHWGKGIATESVSAFTRYVFEHFPCHRIYGEVFAWNPKSARVLEKCGYILEGHLKKAISKDGEYTDLKIYARLREACQTGTCQCE